MSRPWHIILLCFGIMLMLNDQNFYFSGARSKGFAALRTVLSKVAFFGRGSRFGLYVVGFIWLFDEVRAELVLVIFEFFDLLFIWFIILGRKADCKSIYRKHLSNLG